MTKQEIRIKAKAEAEENGYNTEFLKWFLNLIEDRPDWSAELQYRRFFEGGTEI